MKSFRMVYAVMAWLFVVGVAVQVFFAGMAVVARQWPWTNHINLGHSLAGPLLIMLVMAYLGKLPGRMKRLTWLLFGIYILQADVLIFMRVAAPALSALHPVLALADFALGLVLAREATAAARAGEAPLSPQLQPQGSQGD